ncbi:CFEM domain-containing protein [Purpureocillium lilacinum]|uniref:CFEM domain-containing protein n=1 Tax=Purpureocillium lilacinum TaxID=33203 RepID=A0A179GQL7_PURLI|nr:CFEM domain-containing protein [Purpureocillium lilacinum]
MKSIIVALTTLATVALAQDTAGLEQCAQTCANNMLSAKKAEELKCKEGDLKCLCANVNFTYGLRDCTISVCGGKFEDQIIEYGKKICAGAGVVITTGGSNSGSATNTATDGGATKTGGDGSSGDAKVSTIFSTVTGTDGKVQTTPVATTTIGGGEASGTTGNGGVVVTTETSAGSQIIRTLTTMTSGQSGTASGSGTETGTASASETTGESSTGSETGVASTTSGEASGTTGGNGGASQTSATRSGTSSSTGFAAPQKTAAPAGILAAAGLAALFL